MTRDFQKLMKQFQEIQRKSLDKCREFVIRAQAIRDSGKTSPTPITDEKSKDPGETELADQEDAPLVYMNFDAFYDIFV